MERSSGDVAPEGVKGSSWRGQEMDGARHRTPPPEFLQKWQSIADILAMVFGAEAALIMRSHGNEVEVIAKSATKGNPFKVGDRQAFTGDIYCEAVLESGEIYYIDDARKYERWKNSPAIKPGLTSYIGAPVRWPDGELFGTICVLSSTPLSNAEVFRSVLSSFEGVMEDQLKLLELIESQVSVEKTLQKQTRELVDAHATAIRLMNEANMERKKAESLLVELEQYRDHLEILVDERLADVQAEHDRAVRYFDFMAHDIANLLTPALIYAEMLLEEAHVSKVGLSHASRVVKQLKRASTFVLNVRWLDEVATTDGLVYSRVDHDRMVKELIEMVEKESSRSIRISMDVRSAPSELFGAEYVRNLLRGVLRNAVIHSNNEPVQIHVEIDDLDGGGANDRDAVCRIAVSDYGGGIPDATKELLNAPLDFSKRYTRGVASDLSIYKAILNQLGGDLVIKDRVPGDFSKGALVELLVPCRRLDQGPGSEDGGGESV